MPVINNTIPENFFILFKYDFFLENNKNLFIVKLEITKGTARPKE